MYPVSEAFLRAVQENARKYRWSGKITTKAGKVYEFTEKDILKGSGYITRSCCGSNEIELGTVYASEMGITLFLNVDRYSLEDAKVELFYSLRLADGTWETIPMGIYEVSEANRNVKTIELKGYDYMLRFEKNASVESTSGTPYEFLSYACDKCKVELAHTQEEIESMPNGTELLGIYPDGNIETYRDLLFYLAQVLGRVCQINREGKLELIPYGNDPVMKLGAKHRFSSSYSDFVTRYTAIYSTDEVNNKSEYYAMETDDGLTMNLGINPLLQYGLQNGREEIAMKILNTLTPIRYVPFDSDVIGNPALDPMDVIQFTGGHADEYSLSCITSVTYKIYGKQTLKGVGKNPLLSSAKSKADKNIVGLMNQVETSKFVICSYENAHELEIGEEPIRIINVIFASVESTSALFVGNINCTIAAEDDTELLTFSESYEIPTVESIINRSVASAKKELDPESETEVPELVYETLDESHEIQKPVKKNPVVKFTYKVDDNWIAEYIPEQKAVDGENIFSLLYPLGGLGANSAKTMEVYMSIVGGTLTIAPANCKAAVAGSGIASGYLEWDGKIVVEEYVDPYTMDRGAMNLVKMQDALAIHMMPETVHGFADQISLMQLRGDMKLFGMTDSVSVEDGS